MANRTCSIDGCNRPYCAKGYCRLHWRRWSRYGDPLFTKRAVAVAKVDGAICPITGCERPVEKQGLCGSHYARSWRGVPLDTPMPTRAPRGSGYIHHKGYRYFSVDGERIPEHRMVMERVLGRPLEPFENIHHKNGIRTDNRPENLELWVTMQPTGQRPEDLVAWVVAHYPALVRKALEKESYV
jgi:hypothetical protein